LEATHGGAALPLGGPKQRALLALLLLDSNAVVSRDRAIDALWPERPPERAVNALQVMVHGLRRALGTERIETRGSAYLLAAEPRELDLSRFEQLAAEGQAALVAGDPLRAIAKLDDALGLWRGEPLADLPPDTLEAERRQLAESRLGALELRIDAELLAGRHEALVAELEPLVAEHPFRERFRAQQMLALYRSGRQAEALTAYRSARETLDRELGLDPGPALRELERAILRQDASLELESRASRPELPRPGTVLVGRESEVAEACALLRTETRLLTLTGPGGAGKTRLAIETGGELGRELAGGAVFVDLSATTNPELVAATVAAALEIPGQPGTPVEETLIAVLREREPLLVLDNLEQVLDAAPLVEAMLDAAGALRVLATSRIPLRLAGEHVYAVPPLGPEASITVFTARARWVDPEFVLTDADAPRVAAICRALEGIPLAVELAAARIRLLSLDQILERVSRPLDLLGGGPGDLPARHRTVRATIDWSFDLLRPEQQRLFAGMSVFVGGATLDAVEAVCAASLDSLAELLDTSLVNREQHQGRDPRFRMLETVRDYASERLREGGGERLDLGARHVRFFAELAEAVAPELIGPTAGAAVDRLAPDHDNLTAALSFALEHDLEPGFRLAGALRRYWEMAPRGREVRAWLEQAFAKADGSDTPARVGALLVLGRQMIDEGEYDRAPAVFERSLEGARRLGLAREAAVALTQLSWLRAAAGDEAGSERLGQEAVATAREAGDLWSERLGLVLVGAVRVERGEFGDAQRTFDEAIAVARRLQDKRSLLNSLSNSGWAAMRAGDLKSARRRLEEALEVATELDHVTSRVGVLSFLTVEANLAGEPERAEATALDLLAAGRESGRPIHLLEGLSELALALVEREPARAARLLAAADAAYESRGVVRPPTEESRAAKGRKRLAALLGEGYDRECADGATLPLDRAIDEALGVRRA
jgi:predicted ATPase/DNA-binding SARP family transcriptional activator